MLVVKVLGTVITGHLTTVPTTAVREQLASTAQEAVSSTMLTPDV